jgi:hypothetical protein
MAVNVRILASMMTFAPSSCICSRTSSLEGQLSSSLLSWYKQPRETETLGQSETNGGLGQPLIGFPHGRRLEAYVEPHATSLLVLFSTLGELQDLLHLSTSFR